MWYRCNVIGPNLRRSFTILRRYRHKPSHRVHMLSIDFCSQTSVDSFLKRLSEDERKTLSDSLVNVKDKINAPSLPVHPLAFKALCIVAFSNGLPFIGFGFLDNSLMIVAGESIENTWGAMLGISTMASAALGNWISDVIGMGTAGYVEALCYKFGIRPPEMTEEQMDLFSTRFFVVLGRSIGITIGCFLGMIPLLFYNKEKKEDEKHTAAAE